MAHYNNYSEFFAQEYVAAAGEECKVLAAPNTAQATDIVTKLLQNGLAESVEQIVRKQVEQQLVRVSRDFQGPRTLRGADQLEPYDPDVCRSNVDKWIVVFEELGERFGWSDYEKMYLLKCKLSGRAREWYSRVDAAYPHFQWNDWKKELWHAFIRQTDYATDLEEMLARKKHPDEPLASYFQDKLTLCEKCDVRDARAVSCLIKGLPDFLRHKAYSLNCVTPQELIEGVMHLEEAERRIAQEVRFSPPRFDFRRNDFEAPFFEPGGGDARAVCYNCQQPGHLSGQCPKAPQEKRGAVEFETQQDIQKQNVQRFEHRYEPADKIFNAIWYLGDQLYVLYIHSMQGQIDEATFFWTKHTERTSPGA